MAFGLPPRRTRLFVEEGASDLCFAHKLRAFSRCGSRRTHKGDQPLSVIVHLRFVFYLAGTCHSAASVCGRLRVAFVRRNSSGADHCALGNCLHPLALHAYLRKLGFQRVVCDAPISLQVVSISFYFSQLCRISLSLFFYIAISSITADSCLPLFG